MPDPYREVGLDHPELLTAAQVETMTTNLLALIEKADALAAVVRQMPHHVECPGGRDDARCVCFATLSKAAARAYHAARITL